MLIFCAVSLLAGGGLGGYLKFSRVFAILLFPLLIYKFRICNNLRRMITACFFFLAYCIASLIWTPDIEKGIIDVIYHIVHFSLFFELIIFSHYSKKPLMSISAGWFCFALIGSCIAIWELSTGNHLPMAYEENNFIHVDGVLANRMVASATYGNFNSYCVVLCYALPWLYFRLLSSNISRMNKTITTILIIVVMLTILIDGSRGGLISFIIMSSLFLVKLPKSLMKYFIVLILSIIILIMFIKFYDEIFMVLSMRESLLSEFDSNMGMKGGRMAIWITALKVFFPTFGLGVGCGGMEEAMSACIGHNSDIINLTHNMFLEVLLQYGLIWFFVLMLFIFRMIKKANRIHDLTIRVPLQMALWSMPIYCIIDSAYLLRPDLYVQFATIYIFLNYEHISHHIYIPR